MDQMVLLFGPEAPDAIDWLYLREDVLNSATRKRQDREAAPRVFLLRMRMERMLDVAYQVERRLQGKVQRDYQRWERARADRRRRERRWKRFWEV